MNKFLCEKCKRFAGKYPESDNAWACAQSFYWQDSSVIPGHKHMIKDCLRPITAQMTIPPSYCERMLEQTILTPDDKPEIEKDAILQYDGNDRASHEAEYKKWNSSLAKRWAI